MNNVRAHVAAGNQWVRLLYMIFFCVCLYVASLVVPIIVVAQFLFALITGTDNEQLRRFSWSLTLYIKETLLYVTYNSDHKTFPFDDWPSTEELDRRVHPEALDVPAPDHPGAVASAAPEQTRSAGGSHVTAAGGVATAVVAGTAAEAPPAAATEQPHSQPEPVVGTVAGVAPKAAEPQAAAAEEAVAPAEAAPFTAPGVEPVAAAAADEDNLEPAMAEPAAVEPTAAADLPLAEAGVPAPAQTAAETEQQGEVSADDDARRRETIDPEKL